jgi:hypothetical protein
MTEKEIMRFRVFVLGAFASTLRTPLLWIALYLE